jgi:membrane dipeptidase
MSDRACLEAFELYGGPIVASHSNPRRLVPINRLLPDEIIRGICERNGVIGIMPANWALDLEWAMNPKAKIKGNEGIGLDAVVDAIDVICEISGSARHVGIGSDFDGGFGAERVPRELDTVADLPRLADALRNRGYGEDDIEAIMSGNWLGIARRVLAGA